MVIRDLAGRKCSVWWEEQVFKGAYLEYSGYSRWAQYLLGMVGSCKTGAVTWSRVSGAKGALSLQAMLLEHRLLHGTCKGMEEVLEAARLGRAGPGCSWSGLDLGWAPKGLCLESPPAAYCWEWAVTLLKTLLKQGGAETIWESKYFLITVSNKLLFVVNGRKWEKHVVAIMQHRLYCWKRDLVHTFLSQGRYPWGRAP